MLTTLYKLLHDCCQQERRRKGMSQASTEPIRLIMLLSNLFALSLSLPRRKLVIKKGQFSLFLLRGRVFALSLQEGTTSESLEQRKTQGYTYGIQHVPYHTFIAGHDDDEEPKGRRVAPRAPFYIPISQVTS